MTTTSLRKKAAAAALVALTLSGGFAATTTAAQARGGRNGVAAVGALAAVAGLAIAASTAQAHAAPQDYAGAGYEAYDQGYAQPVQYYGHRYREPAYEGYGFEPRHYPRHRPWRDRHYGYAETGYSYRGPVCKIKRQQVFDGYGWTWQRVQVCR